MHKLNITALGESALLIEFGNHIDEQVQEWIQAAASRLENDPFPGYLECVPSFTTLTVYYDLLQVKNVGGSGTAFDYISSLITKRLESIVTDGMRRREVVEIPVCYGGRHGPDLAYVAEVNGLDEKEVIHIHTSQEFLVYALGFTPGFPYLGGLPDSISTPRRATPRLCIPAGSVGIAGSQTGIYPLETPGGWQIIGRTPLALFQPEQDPPVLLKSGQSIRFKAIDSSEYDRLAGESK
ncbi:5-oxoprolinase subunit PxpB [Paenibacillus sp.]|jgi:inhibitor of KinA|uniref:5-oxoprolinase subunit PxpB n=1 Tax=Paenibacillus sp. TaxID=58172 RepID=UPI0028348075|nr:5-oxoprolinase subunit PxpB [Paenibacillus sp.]MDR0271454.1 5-oxoprolinase subunit PxpB [Paenibacillus sp.]